MIWWVSLGAGAAAATVLLTILLFVVLGETPQEMMRGRIEKMRAGQNWTGIAADLKLVRDEMVSTIPMLHQVLVRAPGTSSMQKFISQAGMKTKPAKILLASVVVAAMGYFIADFFVPFYLAAPAGAVLGLVPWGVVAYKRNSRLKVFEERFPDALDMLGRSVRAGHAFTSAIQLVAQESQEPIAGEFAITFEEQNYGIPLRDALQHFSERVPLFDVRFLITALIVQKESGGNLAEILDQLSTVIRERFRIRRDVRTKTAMGRLSAGILVALPILMLFMLMVVNSDYESIMFHDPWGPKILGVAAALQVVGGLLLWRIVNIEV
ncbi:MAG TPA: type II secretion system F family protein [Verrucomicrobiae bacterium]|jgi:tight adherence protein B|nr:type II secretion system F family protein [Verrucomicrobiae bacterium]